LKKSLILLEYLLLDAEADDADEAGVDADDAEEEAGVDADDDAEEGGADDSLAMDSLRFAIAGSFPAGDDGRR
jgi:hypothetical protein